jgi:carboxylate-amine ligase
MTDACPRLVDSVSIASFFRLLVADAIAQPHPGAAYSQTSRLILKENRWRAKRYGIHASFIIEGYDRPFTLEQWLLKAEQALGETARGPGSSRFLSGSGNGFWTARAHSGSVRPISAA